MSSSVLLSADVLSIDAPRVTSELEATIRQQVSRKLRKQGVVLGLSGGVDSSVVAALCVRALGAKRVLGIFMPEEDSESDSLRLGQLLASHLGIEAVTESITPILQGAGCYERRDESIRKVIPEYGPGWKSKLVVSSPAAGSVYSIFTVVVQSPDGVLREARLSLPAYLGIVAATNFKQRSRKMVEYYHADRLNYAVAGTPNRLEYDQGFFVKCGDGAADLKPIAHLYKTQVYQLAEYLGIPDEIRKRPPTTDTYSLPQSQEEFYFSLPFQQMDLCLFARNEGIPAAGVAPAVGLTPEQVELVFANIDAKRRAAAYLHAVPLLAETVANSA